MSRSTVVMAISHAVAGLQLPMKTAPRTRSGWVMARDSATQPPIEYPAMRTASRPRWSIRPMVSNIMSSTEYGAGGDVDGSMPRLSKITT